MNKLKNKLASNRLFAVCLLLMGVFFATLTAPRAMATFTPVEVDPTDAMSQVVATSDALLPVTMTLAVVWLAFHLIRKFLR
jgi:hypothetical protein